MTILNHIRSHVALRNALLVFCSTLLNGVVIGIAAHLLISRWEYDQLQTHMKELLGTVHSSVSIACYLSDTTLGNEIGTGLLKNSFVQRVTILSGKKVLVQNPTVPAVLGVPVDWRNALAPGFVKAEIMSPFNSQEKMCDVFIEPSQAYLDLQIAYKSQFIIYFLLFLTVVLVPFMIFQALQSSSRRIMRIASKIAADPEIDTQSLRTRYQENEDEIDKLAHDIDFLHERLTQTQEMATTLQQSKHSIERLLDVLLKNVHDAVFQIDVAGKLQEANPVFLKLFALDYEKFGLQAPLPAHGMPGIAAAQMLQLIAKTLLDGQHDEHLLFDMPDGQQMWGVLKLARIDKYFL